MALLAELTAADPSGLAASARERGLPSFEARAAVVAAELAAATADAPTEIVRALRFRLAHHHVKDGRYAEALAALTPLRSEGDPQARAWSYELARRSGEAILEVAVLSEETRNVDAVLGTEAEVRLAHGEALARAGDPTGAAAVLRGALAAAAGGPTAVEAAFALFRLAASEPRADSDAFPEALRALAGTCPDEPGLAASALREEALQRVAAGTVEPDDLERGTGPDAGARERAEMAVLHFVAGARLGSARAVAESLVDMAVGAAGDGPVPEPLAPLLGRALARARMAGGDVADAVARRAWQAAHRRGSGHGALRPARPRRRPLARGAAGHPAGARPARGWRDVDCPRARGRPRRRTPRGAGHGPRRLRDGDRRRSGSPRGLDRHPPGGPRGRRPAR